VFAAAPDGRGSAAYRGLEKQGILVRFWDKPGLSDKIRITIGTSQENNALIGGIKALNAAEKAA
jgi:histidinol-phosphate aminotransferase